VIGRAHHDDAVDNVVLPQMCSNGQSERRLTGSRGSTNQPVTRASSQVWIQRFSLPGAQTHRHTRPLSR